MKQIDIPWWPQPRQMTFLRACGMSHPFEDVPGPSPPVADVIGYGGAAGGGKTDSLLAIGMVGGLSYPGCKIGYFRREFPRLSGPGGAIMRSQELMSSWCHWNGTNHRWTLPTKSILQFCNCEKESDVYSYQSQQFDILLFDELTEFTRFQVRYLITRNRATVDGVHTLTAWGSNPGQAGHLHAKSEYVDVGEPEVPHDVEVEPGEFERHIFIPSRLSDNQILEKRDPSYRRKLQAQPELIRRMLLDGDWNIFAGQYFSEWRYDKHVVTPFPIPDSWPRFRSMDWGFNDPASIHWHAIEPGTGRVFTYRELYVRQRRSALLAGDILKLSAGDGSGEFRYTVASPDLWSKRDDGDSTAETIINAGLDLTPADNARVLGWQRVREYLADAPDGMPYWQVFSTCVNLIRTLPALVYDDHKVEDVSDKCEDHAPEDCRYFLMSRPSPIDYEAFMPGATSGHGRPDFDDDEDEDDEPTKVRFWSL